MLRNIFVGVGVALCLAASQIDLLVADAASNTENNDLLTLVSR